jgi:acyl transferase domain-containing protein/NAD(P)-dependent dehydrogenase (short-subunit alcohol dehydrogenase family)
MFYLITHRVLFHDTMAYGTHHFLSNLKFQCEAREHLLFAEILERCSPEERRAFEDVAFLTLDAFSRNLRGAAAGERIAILLSIEEPTLSSVRFCFRVIGKEGQPVACGFQTVATVSIRTRQPVAAPAALRRYGNILRERLSLDNFRSRLLAGNLTAIFSGYAVNAAIEALEASKENSGIRLVKSVPWESSLTPFWRDRLNGCAFLLPGTGSLNWKRLKLILKNPALSAEIRRADKITTTALGHGVSFLVSASNEHGFTEAMRKCPGIDQAANYVAGVLGCKLLAERGMAPDVVVGHSAGELAALAIANAYEFEEGLEVVCQRVHALAPLRGVGGMLALSTNLRRVESLVSVIGRSSLHIAVINHEDQVVVSGTSEDIARLSDLALQLHISHALLPSEFPFHSPLLEPAVESFQSALGAATLRTPKLPVYSPLEQDFYGPALLADILPLHFVRTLDYRGAILRLKDLGIEAFVDCSTGATLKGIVDRTLANRANWNATFAFDDEIMQQHFTAPSAGAPRAAIPDIRDAPFQKPNGGPPPIAIVGLGCVLPGARDPDDLWNNVENRVVSLIDLAEVAPEDAADFLVRGKIVPDKTYSLLSGRVDDASYASSPTGEDQLCLGERLLTTAVSQAMVGIARSERSRLQMFVGSTADGYFELDEAFLAANMEDLARDHEAGREDGRLAKTVKKLFKQRARIGASCGPSAVLSRVARNLLGPRADAIAVDAACASSLYAIQLGAEWLQEGRTDIVICGGVFAPGPVNGCLFSQFGGLSATGSRPFDSSADGVVFCPGAAVVALKRLGDALRDGDRIEGIIRGCGTSSDGKGASVIEPKKEGQVLAITRAYAEAQIEPGTVQYVEAHATATQVGDAVEFPALNDSFKCHRGPISLGSIKSIIGHTGWAAGAASAVKVCLALKHKTLPPQGNFSEPSPEIDLERSPFSIAPVALPWTRGATPRRAGINAFGFGGANSHLIIEEFDPDWHTSTPDEASWPLPASEKVVVVAIGSINPEDGALKFRDDELKLPQRHRVLPDMIESMDRSQLLAIMVADRALAYLGNSWQDWRHEIEVIFGFEGKTANSIRAIERIYLDRVARQLLKQAGNCRRSAAAIARLVDAVRARTRPSGPYSLPGMMPNLIAGRVANLFDLRGANFVVDAASASLAIAIQIATSKVRRGEAKMILAGALSANPVPTAELLTTADGRRGRPLRETAIVLALARSHFAHEVGLKPIATLSVEEVERAASDDVKVGTGPEYLMGAEGASEVRAALATAERGEVPEVISWQTPSGQAVQLRLEPVKACRGATEAPPGETRPASVEYCSIVLEPSPRTPAGKTANLRHARTLVVCDQNEALRLPAGPNWLYVSPPGAGVPGAHELDPGTEADLARNLRAILGSAPPNTINAMILVKDLGRVLPRTPLWDEGRYSAFDLFIVLTRLLYFDIRERRTSLLVLCGRAWAEGALHPWTGLCGGILKSLSRELGGAVCRVVHSDHRLGDAALAQLYCELDREPADVEVMYRHGVRHVPKLIRIKPAVPTHIELPLDENGVVLATGGGRGVTAKLVEAILERRPCRVVLLGRANPHDLPPALQNADENALADYERSFYEMGLREKRGGIKILKQRFTELRAAWEVNANVKLFRSYGASVEYLRADITDPDQVERAIAHVKELVGRLDMIIHGAGIQNSQPLNNKSLSDYRRVVATKVGGLINLERACERHFPGRLIHFHLVTSTFSFLGNDGQTDYGAANEMMNRMAEWHAARGEPWSALAWLGWSGVGMTRGTEYQKLAERRGLRPLSPEEGKALFAGFLLNPAYKPVSVLMSEGESRFYRVLVVDRVADAWPRPALGKTARWDISVGTYPSIADHLVAGRPTLPGAFAVDIAIRSASADGRELPGVTVTELRFEQFIRTTGDRPTTLKIGTRLLRDTREEMKYRVELRSDFVHNTGAVLKVDTLHLACNVHFVPCPPGIAISGRHLEHTGDPIKIPDPYYEPLSPVFLRGPFRRMSNIQIGRGVRTASFLGLNGHRAPELSGSMIPCLLLDALCRLSMLQIDQNGGLPVCVPLQAERIAFAPGVNDTSLAGEEIQLQAEAPTSDGDLICNKYAQAVASNGRVLLSLENFTAKRMT